MTAREELAALEFRWTGVRGHVQELLPVVLDLVTRIEQDAEERLALATAESEAHCAGRIAEAERREEAANDRAAAAGKLYQDLKRERLSEERRASDESLIQVTVTVDGGWKLADLEDVAYRLRCAGGTDATTVTVGQRSVSALVPDPSMVRLVRAPEPTIPAPARQEPGESAWRDIIKPLAIGFAACIAGFCAVILLGGVIG